MRATAAASSAKRIEENFTKKQTLALVLSF